MNPIIKRELEKVRVDLPEYDDDTTTIVIKKQGETINNNSSFLISHSYLIKIADYIINEPQQFTLSSNWNKGITPKSQYLNVQVSNIVGNMIQVDACGYDYENKQTKNDVYIGLWLPRKSITILEELKDG